jgi:hypothetical protein
MYMTLSVDNLRKGSIALIAFVLLALPISFVHAADLDTSYDFYPDTSYDFYPDTSYDFYPDTSYDFYPDISYDFYPDSYWYYPSYSTGYISGVSYLGGSYIGGSSYLPTRITSTGGQTQTQTQVSTNTNTNTNTNNVNVTVNVPTQTQTYPVCNTCGCYGYAPCYRAPIAYNTTPYVALSAVPYTGLELGFWGTILYWGFLVLWCLVAAYLIVVKKVQNRVLSALNRFLFGESLTPAVAGHAHAPVASTTVYSAPLAGQAVATSTNDAIDDFIMSQINKVSSR